MNFRGEPHSPAGENTATKPDAQSSVLGTTKDKGESTPRRCFMLSTMPWHKCAHTWISEGTQQAAQGFQLDPGTHGDKGLRLLLQRGLRGFCEPLLYFFIFLWISSIIVGKVRKPLRLRLGILWG